MADTDKETQVVSELSGIEGTGDGDIQVVTEDATTHQASGDVSVPEFCDVEGSEKGQILQDLVSALDSAKPIRPSLVALGSNNSPSLSIPHPKRFNAVNINKKFLEKNSSGSSSNLASSSSLSTKSGGPVSRPLTQSSLSHSRLVTTKLTTAPQGASTTGPGWSRPSSAAPPAAPAPVTSTNGTSLLPSALAPTMATSQLPHVGKVIQPQPHPRAVASPPTSLQKETSSSKPVWGNVRLGVTSSLGPDVRVHNDFPTAAEVAQSATSIQKAKNIDMKEAAESAAASKQARMEEADTFRGVHLDPNAHHWDEMEEDDDNFLDGVIEFGDGRQYRIQSDDLLPQPLSSIETASSPRERPSSRLEGLETTEIAPVPNVPVTKEERFADDNFDRSWPPKASPSLSTEDFPPTGPHPSVPASPVSSHALSPQESSRVLFNERSNRLEPYSNVNLPHRPAIGQYPSKRANYSDFSTSPTESRNGREVFPPSQGPSNVQLLQKHSVNDFTSRPRRFSSGFGAGPSNINTLNTDRSRDWEKRESQAPPQSPRIRDNFGGPPSLSSTGKGREGNERGRQLSTMGPPLPHPIRGLSKDTGRQLPPHLSGPPLLAQKRMSSRDPHLPITEGSSAHTITRSPVLSHTSNSVLTSPTSEVLSSVAVVGIDLEEARKDVMQNAAARAKQRRQQEEEEREKAMERAKRKATELEEKIKAAEAEKAKVAQKEEKQIEIQEEKVVAIVEEAVANVDVPKEAIPPPDHIQLPSHSPRLFTSPALPFAQSPPRRPPSIKSMPRLHPEVPRPPLLERVSSTQSSASAIQADSWRSKASPLLPLPPTPRQTQARLPIPAFLAPPPLSVLDQVDSLAEGPEEELEVVDFSDLAKFVGIPDDPVAEEPSGEHVRTSRPVASDFFDNRSHVHNAGPVSKSDIAVWRRTYSGQSEQQNDGPSSARDILKGPDPVESSLVSDTVSTTSKETSGSLDHQVAEATQAYVTSHPSQQRALRAPTFYKEAAMSALDDTLSRIKGALDGMQADETAREHHHPPSSADIDDHSLPLTRPSLPLPLVPVKQSPLKERWTAPALRIARQFDDDQLPREVFHITGCDPPRSPRPAWNHFIVRLPKISKIVEPLNKRQLFLSKPGPAVVRWDILSWNPPVEGMNRRDFSLNDVLFRKQPVFKGKLKYRIVLPRRRPIMDVTGSPKVNLPVKVVPPKVNGVGAFGRPRADDLSTWRKSAGPSAKIEAGDTIASESGLSTTSRSPPPGLDSGATSIPKHDIFSTSKTDGPSIPMRSRSQPKMPAGSAVAFYRDSRIDSVDLEPKSFVNFIVNSELEESRQSQLNAIPSKAQPIITVSSPSSALLPIAKSDGKEGSAPKYSTPPVVNGLISQPTSPDFAAPSLVQSKAESKSSDDSTDHVLVTPPSRHASSTWAKSPISFPVKESPARRPDPEHLKAVWSQASDKAGLPAINSLEGIADDLTAIPFTLQDVKSEDGETPPPSNSTAPPRMSLHDVTRAFQQVPSSSSSSSVSRTTPMSPPSTTAPVARPPPNYMYSHPHPPNPSMRPTYGPYPSPMMSHSHSSAGMYPHSMTTSPAPTRMSVSGHAPVYGQPLWMPLPGPPAQNHNGMMRSMPSPYPAQLVPYPSPGTPSMYPAPPIVNMQPQQNNSSQSHGRNMISPIMSHAGPFYAGSPVLMHAPIMQVPQSHGYMQIPAGRGQMRNEVTPTHLPIQHPPPGQHPSHSGYAPVPSTSFVRPTW